MRFYPGHKSIRLKLLGLSNIESRWNEEEKREVKMNKESQVRCFLLLTGHVNNIPIMQFFTGISRYTQANSNMLSLIEYVWEFQNNVLWDTHYNALLFHGWIEYVSHDPRTLALLGTERIY